MKKRETEKNNQKTSISKKHTKNTKNTDASCDKTITNFIYRAPIKTWNYLLGDEISKLLLLKL